jgi:hypothetical protein
MRFFIYLNAMFEFAFELGRVAQSHREMGQRASAAVIVIATVREVLEARVLAEEREVHFASRAVALLGDDDVGDALARRVRVRTLPRGKSS